MPRPSPYTDAQKSAILEAVTSARKTGTWPDALKAAQGAGFNGGLQYLMKFAGGSKRRGRKTGKVAATTKGASLKSVQNDSETPTAEKSQAAAPGESSGPRYTAEMKSAIMTAAIAARGDGKRWSEAHEAAKEAGYRGSLQGIVKMIRGGNRKPKRDRKPIVAAAPTVTAAKKRGRPKGSKNAVKRSPGRPKTVGLNGIDAIVERMVEERWGAKIGAAVEALEAATTALKTL